MAATTTGAEISPWLVLIPRIASSFDAKRGFGLSTVYVTPWSRARAEKIVGDAGAVAIAGIGFVGGKLDFIHRPVWLQLLEFSAIDELHIDAEFALHFHILLEPFAFARMNYADKAGLAEVSLARQPRHASAQTSAG